MSYITSPNMGLQIPGVGTEPGPEFAFEVNTSLNLVDQHDHTPGRGTQIPPTGLNINTDLTFQNNSATNLESVVFQNQVSVSTLQGLYVKPGSESPPINDLWFNDGAGNAVQLTSGGLVNATIASIPGQSYAGGTFTWKQGAGSTTPANFDIGSITLRPNVAATTNGVILGPPSGISSQYNINLPLLPSIQSFVSIDNSGIMNTFAPTGGPANATSLVPPPATSGQYLQTPGGASNPVWVSLSGITTAQLSPTAGILGTQIANSTIALVNMATITNATTTGSSYLNNTGTFTTIVLQTFTSTNPNARPYFISFSGAGIRLSPSATPLKVEFQLIETVNSVIAANWTVNADNDPTSTNTFAEFSPGSFNWCGIIGAATVNRIYALQAKIVGGAGAITTPGVTINVIQI
jgi:hypothetical protein